MGYRLRFSTLQLELTKQVFLKLMKHSTDLSAPAHAPSQQDRNAPPQTALSAYGDCVGVLLGLDLDGVMEVEDCFALPAGEKTVGGACCAF
jgi:translation initiation factor 3 subunit H